MGWLLLLLVLVGCASSSHSNISQSPAESDRYFSEAQDIYSAALEKPTSGPEHAAAMNEVVKRIESAIQHQSPSGSDFVSPMYHSRLGELLLDIARNDSSALARAESALQLSVSPPRGCEEWVPGWLGLARWAMLSGKGAYAAECLERAETELELLERRAGKQGDLPALALGGERQRSDDPSLSSGEQLQLLIGWLVTNETWLDRHRAAGAAGQIALQQALGQPQDPLPDLGPAPIAGVMSDSLASMPAWMQMRQVARRLRARIGFAQAEMAIASDASAERVLSLLDQARRYDPDYFPIELEYAAQLRRAGRPAQAEKFLLPYLTRPDVSPVFRRNVRLWLEAGRLYSDWYAANGDATAATSAERAFRTILGDEASPGLDPENGEVYADFAKFYTRVAESKSASPEQRAAAMDAARVCREHAAALSAGARATIQQRSRS